jgi:hemerythrin-like metal-binding protein
MTLPWLHSMNVGIADLDAEHRHLYELLDEVIVNVEDGNISGARVLVEELLIATDENFSREEAGMDKWRYPGAAAHKLDHARGRLFLRQLVQAVRELAMDQARQILMDYSAHHFRHLLADDSLLANYLKETVPAVKVG